MIGVDGARDGEISGVLDEFEPRDARLGAACGGLRPDES